MANSKKEYDVELPKNPQSQDGANVVGKKQEVDIITLAPVASQTAYTTKQKAALWIGLVVSVAVVIVATAVIVATVAPDQIPNAITNVLGGLTPVAAKALFGAAIGGGTLAAASTIGISYLINKSRKDLQVPNAGEQLEQQASSSAVVPSLTMSSDEG